jgi:hypothetical protein
MDQNCTPNTKIKNLFLLVFIVFQLSNITIGIILLTKKINQIDIPSKPPKILPKITD